MQSKISSSPQRSRFWRPFRRSGLRVHMTLSYVSVTLGSVLSFIILAALASGALSAAFFDSSTGSFLAVLQRQAQSYALVASFHAQDASLDPHTSFVPGQALTLTLPDQQNLVYPVSAPFVSTSAPDPASIAIALLIAPDGHLVTSSYPSRYAAGMSIAALLPEQTQAISRALVGRSSMGTEYLSSAIAGYAAEPVWSRSKRLIGAIFLQAPEPEEDTVVSRLWSTLLGNSIFLLLVIPLGIFFGRITTRSLVDRLQRLVVITRQFAAGDYTQRVLPVQQDEIGRLEAQFNSMAEQIVEHISQRQQLAEQNARLEERSRISRELHDAISQDLFSLRMLADGLQEATRSDSPMVDLRPHIALLEQTTMSMTREMRALLLELRPTQLETLGLIGALKQLAHAYSTRLGITVTTDLNPVALDVKSEHALLRIAQEAMANAARHSNATIVSLALGTQGKAIRLTIADNGDGFSREISNIRQGLGLHLMQERVEELHGTLELKTAPGQGTSITVSLPLEEASD